MVDALSIRRKIKNIVLFIIRYLYFTAGCEGRCRRQSLDFGTFISIVLLISILILHICWFSQFQRSTLNLYKIRQIVFSFLRLTTTTNWHHVPITCIYSKQARNNCWRCFLYQSGVSTSVLKMCVSVLLYVYIVINGKSAPLCAAMSTTLFPLVLYERQPPRGTKKSIKKHKKRVNPSEGNVYDARFSPRPIKRRFPFLFFYYFDTYTTNLPPVFPPRRLYCFRSCNIKCYTCDLLLLQLHSYNTHITPTPETMRVLS